MRIFVNSEHPATDHSTLMQSIFNIALISTFIYLHFHFIYYYMLFSRHNHFRPYDCCHSSRIISFTAFHTTPFIPLRISTSTLTCTSYHTTHSSANFHTQLITISHFWPKSKAITLVFCPKITQQ